MSPVAPPSDRMIDSPAACANEEVYGTPYMLRPPAGAEEAPVVFASPHSGNVYPDVMLAALRVDVMDLRRTEDAFVDELFDTVPAMGAWQLSARFGRSVTDLNRDPRELDATMFEDGAPRACGIPTARVEAGLGCLPRVAATGQAIYQRRLTKAEGEARLSGVHDTYHAALTDCLSDLKDRHGACVLIDCHSMPSVQPGRRNLSDIVLGDRFGSSCDHRLTGCVERAFRRAGLSVARNAPYAGGYTTRRYGRPKRHVHGLQIEINRGLYMDERAVVKASGFDDLRAILAVVSADIVGFSQSLS